MNMRCLLAMGASMASLAIAAPALAQAGVDAAASPTEAAAPGPLLPTVSTLKDALTLTATGDPSILSSQAQQRAAEDRYSQARAAFGPSVNLEGRYGYTDLYQRVPRFTTTTPRSIDGWSGSAQMTVSQTVFSSGRLSSQLNSALESARFQKQNMRFIENKALLETITSYVGVRRDQALFSIANDNLTLLDQQFSDSDQRFRVREITRTDLDQVVTRVEQGRATVAQAKGNLESSLGQFVNDVGALPGDLEPPPALPNIPQTLEEAYAAAENMSPTMLAARARERTSHAQLKGAYAELGPNVSLQGSAVYGGTGVSLFLDDVHQRILRGEVVVQMPIFSSGQRIARIREAKNTNDSDWRLVDATLRDIHSSVNAAWSQLMSTRAALSHLQLSVEAAQRAYDGSNTQLRAGARTTLDVLDLARDLLNARSSYVTAQADEYVARANLLATIGRLEAKDLYPDIPTTYDAEKYHHKSRILGGTPIISDITAAADSLLWGSSSDDRKPRDSAAGIKAGPGVPPAAEPTAGP